MQNVFIVLYAEAASFCFKDVLGLNTEHVIGVIRNLFVRDNVLM